MMSSAMLLLLSAAATAVHALPQIGSAGMNPSERIYFQSWNIGEQCSSNKIPGCRAAAIEYLTGKATGPNGYGAGEIQVFVTAGLAEAGGEPVDLTTLGELKGKNFTQVDAVCRPGLLKGSESVSLTLYPGFDVVKTDGGCLGEKAAGARAFIAALVTPPTPLGGNDPRSMLGGEVKGCPKGICIIGMHAPDGAITAGAADTIKKTCGEDVVKSCTVTVGDFSKDTGKIAKHYNDLGLGRPVSSQGVDRSMVATNVPGTGQGMDIGQGYPLQKQFGTIPGQSPAELVDLLLPCQYPNTFEYCKK